MSVGILVHGSNHFIVKGKRPSIDEARALIRHWEFPTIGAGPAPGPWTISTIEFRENLEWAIDLTADTGHSPAVDQLLHELAARGVTIEKGAGLALQSRARKST
jgi:hypothetical protein